MNTSILVMEDDVNIQELIVEFLKAEGYDVDYASDGLEGIQLFKKKEYNLVLLDIKHIDKDMYKKITSVDLESTLKFIQYLQEINKPVWLRYVLLPGYTDDIKDLNDWAKYVSQFDVVKRVDILPFHQMAIYKWEKTNREYKLKDVSTPTKEQIQKAEEIFNKYDLPLYKERS